MKNVIKILIILLIITIVILLIIILNLKGKQNDIQSENVNIENQYFENDYIDDGSPQDDPIELSKNTVKEENDYVVFSISDIIQRLFKYISNNNVDAVYSMTNFEYKNANNINKENVISIYSDINSEKEYYIQDVYTLQDYEKQVYYTYGILIENNKFTDCYLKVEIINDLFSIQPLDIETYNAVKKGEINTLKDFSIEKNQYNNYEFLNLSSKDLAERYISDFLLKIKCMPDFAYKLLEENYRKSTFNNIQEFKNYINNNYNTFENFTISTCDIKVKEDSIEYIVFDELKNYYKIIVYKAMNYRIILER